MQNARKRWIVWSAIALVVGLVLVWGLLPKAQSVELATAERGSLQVTLDEEGETRVCDRFIVSAPVAGRLLRIELEPGDPVEGGETVLAIFAPQNPIPLDARARAEAEAQHRAAHAALDRARAELNRARGELDFAVTDRERYRRLATEAVVSEEKVDAAELEARRCEDALHAAEHAVEGAVHQLKAAESRLIESGEAIGDSTGLALHSPIDGVVLRRLRESESIVPAGEPLLEVGDPADLEIVADFLSSDAVRIRPRDAVLVERWGGKGTLHGRVRRVEPSGFMKVSALGVEEQRVNVIIDVEEPPAMRPGLGDGFRVEVRVVVWEADDVLSVPVGSVFRSSEGWAAYRVDDGRARQRSVEIGERGTRRVEIRSGLADGDVVILHPGEDVADGVRVKRRPD